MDKESLLKEIAETGYNVGFGSCKHFATLDIISKAPGWIGFLSISFGVYALIIDSLSGKFYSATFVILGIIGLYISFYDDKKNNYEQAGVKIRTQYNELRQLYHKTKNINSTNIQQIKIFEQEFKKIESDFYSTSITKQILFSDWYAHYKFFWQLQIDWINKERGFSFFRDKIPLTFYIFIISITIAILICFFKQSIISLFPCLR